MNSHIKTFSLLAGALLLGGVIYCLQGCQKEPPLGPDDARVTKAQNSNTSPQPTSAPMSPPPPTATPEVIVAAKPSPSKEKRAVAAQRAQQAARADDYVAARRQVEVIEGARKNSVELPDERWTAYASSELVTTPRASDPSELIAEASALLRDQRSKQALTVVDRALELIKAQPEPDNAQQNKQYLNTKRAALAVRAKALSALASTSEPTRIDDAEMAYNEYLAVESDPLKRSAAENELASLLYESGQWEKAKVIYQRMLAINPKNPTALARLAGIMRAIAKEQESAGRTTEAKTSSDAADNYSERLREVGDPNRYMRRPAAASVIEQRTKPATPAGQPPVGKKQGTKAGRKIP